MHVHERLNHTWGNYAIYGVNSWETTNFVVTTDCFAFWNYFGVAINNFLLAKYKGKSIFSTWLKAIEIKNTNKNNLANVLEFSFGEKQPNSK